MTMRRIALLALLAALAQPALHQSALAEGPRSLAGLEQDYEPDPAMWRLADADTTIYMLGTVHLLPDGFRWRTAQLDAIVAEVDELVLESSDPDAEASMAYLDGKFARMLEQRRPTSQQLSPGARAKWRRLVELSGQPFEVVDRMPLMVVLMGLGAGEGISSGLSSYEHGVETILEAEFGASGRPVSSIEDAGRVMMSLYRISDDLVVDELEGELMVWDGRSAASFFGQPAATGTAAQTDWSLEHAWARGDVAQLTAAERPEGKLAEAFHNALLANRNRRWAQWLDDRLDQPGTILLAVGAAHFEGPDSVLEMLHARGLAAERINQPAQ